MLRKVPFYGDFEINPIEILARGLLAEAWAEVRSGRFIEVSRE